MAYARRDDGVNIPTNYVSIHRCPFLNDWGATSHKIIATAKSKRARTVNVHFKLGAHCARCA